MSGGLESERGDEADPRRFDACFAGDSLHLEAYEVVSEEDPPQLLLDSGRASAADRFLAVEQLRLDLVVAELQLPALVVQRRDLVGWKRVRIGQRGEQGLRAEALPLIGDSSRDTELWQARVLLASFARDLDLDERVRFIAYEISPAAYGPKATAASKCDRSAMSPTPRTMG
jgi:hypothetical protein